MCSHTSQLMKMLLFGGSLDQNNGAMYNLHRGLGVVSQPDKTFPPSSHWVWMICFLCQVGGSQALFYVCLSHQPTGAAPGSSHSCQPRATPGTALTWSSRELVPRGATTQSVAGTGSDTGRRCDCPAEST